MKILLKVAAFGLMAALASVRAQAQETPASGTSPPADNAPVVLPEEKRWRIGAALGYGLRSNPLIQSDDIPIAIDLDLAWFGDRWFFDNGDLGVLLMDNAVVTTNLVARLNSDRAFFSKTNTKYVTFSVLPGGMTGAMFNPDTGQPITAEQEVPPQPLKAPDRDYAIEVGVETLFSGEWGQAALRAFHDVSGTHHGYEIAGDYSYRFGRGRFSFSPMLGLSWKSADLSNYYWGVHPDEATFTLRPYEVKAGLGWEVGVRANYYLTKTTRLALSANYEQLQHSVAQSPLVEEDHVLGYFAGVAWQF
jgi:outer membrane protein